MVKFFKRPEEKIIMLMNFCSSKSLFKQTVIVYINTQRHINTLPKYHFEMHLNFIFYFYFLTNNDYEYCHELLQTYKINLITKIDSIVTILFGNL